MNIIETNLTFREMNTRTKTEYIVLHHSGVEVLQDIKTIHQYHKYTNGWAGIGYHFYVRKDGKVYRGRPENAVGAHAVGANYNSVGICFEGNFSKETMKDVQLKAGQELVVYLKDKYNISKVIRHKDVDSTDCPGKNFPYEKFKKETTIKKDSAYTTFVKEVQKACGAKVDGIAGPETLSKTVTISKSKNSKHKVVKAVQKYLISLGYVMPKYGADGWFGSETETAVKKYQKDNDCVVDGEITAKCKTWKKLLKLA